MSSIAYVTDEQMLEYHRLCGNRSINFWRLSTKKGFTNFKKGDLLFFYARKDKSTKKALLGYAHYVSTQQLSLKQMWKKYGSSNGYNDITQMEEAIRKASRTKEIPSKLNCLYLTDAVYFLQPVYPEEVGLSISNKLESYCYLDKEDPQITVRILKEAEKGGIDIWSAAQSFEPENVFRQDALRHQLAVIRNEIGKDGRNDREENLAKRLANEKLKQGKWELIRGSNTDLYKEDNGVLTIGLPLVYQNNDKDIRLKEFLGTTLMYKLKVAQYNLSNKPVRFEIISASEEKEIQDLLEGIMHE